jgi:hypothetical protein
MSARKPNEPPDRKWRKWRPEEQMRRLSGFRLPESQGDWVERIAEAENRSVPEVVRLLVQQGPEDLPSWIPPL